MQQVTLHGGGVCVRDLQEKLVKLKFIVLCKTTDFKVLNELLSSINIKNNKLKHVRSPQRLA